MEEGNCSKFTDVSPHEESDMLDNGGEAGRVTTTRVTKASVCFGVATATALLVLAAFTKGSMPAVADLVNVDSTALVQYSASSPDFMVLLSENSVMTSLLLGTQIQQESKVQSGILYSWQTPGAKAENAIGLLLRSIAKQKTFEDLPDGCSLYWTLQIRLARANKQSKWHSFAKSLKTGEQTIKYITPSAWNVNRVSKWKSSRSTKVFVF